MKLEYLLKLSYFLSDIVFRLRLSPFLRVHHSQACAWQSCSRPRPADWGTHYSGFTSWLLTLVGVCRSNLTCWLSFLPDLDSVLSLWTFLSCSGRAGWDRPLLVTPLQVLLMAPWWTPGSLSLAGTNMDYTIFEITHISHKHLHHPSPKQDIKHFGQFLQFVSENLKQ